MQERAGAGKAHSRMSDLHAHHPKVDDTLLPNRLATPNILVTAFGSRHRQITTQSRILPIS